MSKQILTIWSIFLFLILSWGYHPALGQPDYQKHEITVSFGLTSHPEVLYDFAQTFAGIFVVFGAAVEQNEVIGGGVWSLTYGRQLTNKLNIGAALTTQKFGVRNTASGQITESHRVWSLLFRARLQYSKHPSFFPYSSLGLGYGTITDKADPQAEVFHHLAAQLGIIGLHLGREAGVFAELGYGWQGVLRLGARFRFN